MGTWSQKVHLTALDPRGSRQCLCGRRCNVLEWLSVRVKRGRTEVSGSVSLSSGYDQMGLSPSTKVGFGIIHVRPNSASHLPLQKELTTMVVDYTGVLGAGSPITGCAWVRDRTLTLSVRRTTLCPMEANYPGESSPLQMEFSTLVSL